MERPESASEAARRLNKARWGTQVLSRSVAVVIERADELTAEQLDELRHLADEREETR